MIFYVHISQENFRNFRKTYWQLRMNVISYRQQREIHKPKKRSRTPKEQEIRKKREEPNRFRSIQKSIWWKISEGGESHGADWRIFAVVGCRKEIKRISGDEAKWLRRYQINQRLFWLFPTFLRHKYKKYSETEKTQSPSECLTI